MTYGFFQRKILSSKIALNKDPLHQRNQQYDPQCEQQDQMNSPIIGWSRWRPVQFGEAESAITWTVCGDHCTISWLPEINNEI